MAGANDPADLSTLPQSDQDAIGTTLLLLAGIQARDADQLTNVYSANADWVNAFGTVKRVDRSSSTTPRGLCADANFNAGRLKAPPDVRVRVLTPDVVLVSAHLTVEGQKLVAGGTIEQRDNHPLRMLQRRPDGSWPIVSEMFMDANQGETYAGGS